MFISEIINLLFVPTLAIYLHYKKNNRAFKPSLELLFQYCIAAGFNFALAKLILSLINMVAFTVSSVDSGHYTIAALFSAWLLPKLYVAGQNIHVKLEVTKVAAEDKKEQKTAKKGEETGDEKPKNP